MNTDTALYSEGLERLIHANEPLWGGEAEVIRTFWSSPVRTPDTDRKWLIHQIYKEYWDGILPPLEQFRQALPGASVKRGRDNLLTMAEVLHEEVEHFVLFAELYRALDGSDYALTPEQLKELGAWVENDELMSIRQRHKEESTELGLRAHRFTEGGYCALFTEGMALRGSDERDDAIAQVCRKIFEDEFNHMLLGILDIDDSGLTESDWDTLISYTVEQMKSRILMRNAQFSHPVPAARLEQLLAGAAEPVRFNFQFAEQLLARGSGKKQVVGG